MDIVPIKGGVLGLRQKCRMRIHQRKVRMCSGQIEDCLIDLVVTRPITPRVLRGDELWRARPLPFGHAERAEQGGSPGAQNAARHLEGLHIMALMQDAKIRTGDVQRRCALFREHVTRHAAG
ncbi:hypothetical protein D3C87_602900 [compost metagenome]